MYIVDITCVTLFGLLEFLLINNKKKLFTYYHIVKLVKRAVYKAFFYVIKLKPFYKPVHFIE
ncbi:hypothetical protein DU428_00610 [Oceanihabitans sediminis]|uniref:Uncharacterized protein n=1 Tax=Oceanihabitans sediminis TaxID=1812012 RepID=A0A368P643_9FLAO|nr:hypothetical protein DU428_00610 [Oceanihabitans sediminis]